MLCLADFVFAFVCVCVLACFKSGKVVTEHQFGDGFTVRSCLLFANPHNHCNFLPFVGKRRAV